MAVNQGMRAVHLLTALAVADVRVKPVFVNRTHFAVKWSGMPPVQAFVIPRADNAGAEVRVVRSMVKDVPQATNPDAMDVHVKTAFVS